MGITILCIMHTKLWVRIYTAKYGSLGKERGMSRFAALQKTHCGYHVGCELEGKLRLLGQNMKISGFKG